MNPEIAPARRPVDRLARSSWLNAPADAAQALMRSAGSRFGSGAAPLGDALHGSWLGHALHPMLTDVPIGAWSVAAVCDVLDLAGATQYAVAADLAIAVGTAAGVAAELTGWADWSDTKDDPKRLGIGHAGLAGGAVTAYVLSLGLRRAGQRAIARWLGFAGLGLTVCAAYLGGELSTGMGLGTRHTVTPATPPADFVDVCSDDELPEGTMKRFDLAGVSVLIAKTAGDLSAVSAVCTHRGGPLDGGERDGTCVTCPWHGARFSLRDGTVREGPATFPLATFETRRRGGRIELRFAAHSGA